MDIFGASDIGRKRKSNQDVFHHLKFDKDGCFAVVCDGMGGQNGGDVASKMVKDFFVEKYSQFLKEDLSEEEIKNLVFSYFQEANKKVLEMSFSDESLKGMGTTCVVVILKKGCLMVFSVGDSRVYVKTDENFKQMTVDHSYVQTLIDCGEITKEEAKFHPRKNEITNAIGISENLVVDYNSLGIKKKDYILLCTDGLTNSCSDDEIFKVIDEEEDVFFCVEKLINLANLNGGEDNITVVLIKV